MCIGVNSFSIWCADALLHSYRVRCKKRERDCFGMKVKNGNEIIKFALTVDAERTDAFAFIKAIWCDVGMMVNETAIEVTRTMHNAHVY